MRVMAQVCMVMNLDKCIGCHTCTVTCKQTWTNRPGTEYVYFNNVETKPGLGYPARYEDQDQLEGRLGARPQGPPAPEGREPAQAAGVDLLQPRPAHDRRLPRSVHLRLRPADHRPGGHEGPERVGPLGAHRPGDGPQVGHQLGGRPGRRPGTGPRRPEHPGDVREGPARFRVGLHVLPAPDLRALPQPQLCRVVPVGGHVQAGGGRDRPRRPGPLPGLAVLRVGLSVQEGVLQPPHRQGREVHALLPPHRGRACPPSARRPAPGGCAIWASCSTTPTPSPAAAATPDPEDLYEAQLSVFLDPNDPAVAAEAEAPGDPARLGDRGAALARLRADRPSPRRPAAAPRVPDDAHGLVHPAALPSRRRDRRCRLRRGRAPTPSSPPSTPFASPLEYLANLFTRRAGRPGARCAAPPGHASGR